MLSVNLSRKKGEPKLPVGTAMFNTRGMEGDAHAGDWHRQVSLLDQSSVDRMLCQCAEERGQRDVEMDVEMDVEINYGDFAENITTRDMDLLSLPLGQRLRIGQDVILEVTQHGKKCHHGCSILKRMGDCIMPREGAFARVIREGTIGEGDPIYIQDVRLSALDEAMVGQPMDSRKSRVFVFRDGENRRVAKAYREGAAELAASEYRILQLCRDRGIPVPKPESITGGLLVLECVKGDNLMDVLYGPKDAAGGLLDPQLSVPVSKEADDLLSRWADWLAGFHRAFSGRMYRGDCIPRNFLVTDRGIVGLDFEEAGEGDPVRDLGDVCASLLRNGGMFTRREFFLARRFAEMYKQRAVELVPKNIDTAVTDSLRRYAQHHPRGDQLLQWADKIQRDGLMV